MHDKERLFHFRRASTVNLYELDGFYDYFYGYMVPSTGLLRYFELYPYEEGLVLQMPTISDTRQVPPFTPQVKVTKALLDSVRWSERLGAATVADLNECIVDGRIQDLILVQEALQDQKLSDLAAMIGAHKDIKFIMIAGPSSSGKTTFSHRLSIQLRAHGLKPHPIGVDDYFLDRERTPRDADGNYNFEDLDSIDVECFNRDMNALLEGKRVELPRYNFKTGHREYRGEYLQLGAEDILVIEGIHCLNGALYPTLPKENMFKIYISALTQLNVDEHNRVATTDGRLIRRMVRDAAHRGITAQETIQRWGSVRRGEEKNIFPYQETADAVFNSAQVYELSVLKPYAEPLLFSVPKDAPEYQEAKRLLKFLDYFLTLPDNNIPNDSILREFVGGSVFNV
jgi:uridine kinase